MKKSFKLISLVLTIALLSQNMSWAHGEHTLAPSSGFQQGETTYNNSKHDTLGIINDSHDAAIQKIFRDISGHGPARPKKNRIISILGLYKSFLVFLFNNFYYKNTAEFLQRPFIPLLIDCIILIAVFSIYYSYSGLIRAVCAFLVSIHFMSILNSFSSAKKDLDNDSIIRQGRVYTLMDFHKVPQFRDILEDVLYLLDHLDPDTARIVRDTNFYVIKAKDTTYDLQPAFFWYENREGDITFFQKAVIRIENGRASVYFPYGFLMELIAAYKQKLLEQPALAIIPIAQILKFAAECGNRQLKCQTIDIDEHAIQVRNAIAALENFYDFPLLEISQIYGSLEEVIVPLKTALKEVGAYCDGTADSAPLEFIGFSQNDRPLVQQTIRTSILPEIKKESERDLDYQLIRAYRLTDGTLRLVKKPVEFNNIVYPLDSPATPLPVDHTEEQITEAIVRAEINRLVPLIDTESGRQWVYYCLRKVLTNERPKEIEKFFFSTANTKTAGMLLKLFYKALKEIDPAKAGLVILSLLERCQAQGANFMCLYLQTTLANLLAQVASLWNLDPANHIYLRAFLINKLRNDNFLRKLYRRNTNNTNIWFLVNDEIGPVVELRNDDSGVISAYFPDDLAIYITELLAKQDFEFPFREAVEKKLAQISNRPSSSTETDIVAIKTYYMSSCAYHSNRKKLKTFITEYSMHLPPRLQFGIIIGFDIVRVLLVPEYDSESIWGISRYNFKPAGFVHGRYVYPVSEEAQAALKTTIPKIAQEYMQFTFCPPQKSKIADYDDLLLLSNEERERNFFGQDAVAIMEIDKAISAEPSRDISIVDIGAGTGNLLQKLKTFYAHKRSAFIHLYGVEPNMDFKQAARANLPENIHVCGVRAEELHKACFADEIKDTYKIAVLEDVTVPGITHPKTGANIIAKLLKKHFDRIIITGSTYPNIGERRLQSLAKRYNYTLRKTLIPQNLFTQNQPKFVFVISKIPKKQSEAEYAVPGGYHAYFNSFILFSFLPLLMQLKIILAGSLMILTHISPVILLIMLGFTKIFLLSILTIFVITFLFEIFMPDEYRETHWILTKSKLALFLEPKMDDNLDEPNLLSDIESLFSRCMPRITKISSRLFYAFMGGRDMPFFATVFSFTFMAIVLTGIHIPVSINIFLNLLSINSPAPEQIMGAVYKAIFLDLDKRVFFPIMINMSYGIIVGLYKWSKKFRGQKRPILIDLRPWTKTKRGNNGKGTNNRSFIITGEIGISV